MTINDQLSKFLDRDIVNVRRQSGIQNISSADKKFDSFAAYKRISLGATSASISTNSFYSQKYQSNEPSKIIESRCSKKSDSKIKPATTSYGLVKKRVSLG